MNRRNFIKRTALFVPAIFIPKIIRATPAFTKPGFFRSKPVGGLSGSPLVTSQTTTGTLRQDFDGAVGFRFKVGTSPITVTSLGRWVVSGNSKTHVLHLTDDSCTDIVTTTVNCSGATAGQYLYGSIASTVLSAATFYRVMSDETTSAGFDNWYEEAPITTTSDVNSAQSAYHNPSLCLASVVGNSYVPVNLLYHL